MQESLLNNQITNKKIAKYGFETISHSKMVQALPSIHPKSNSNCMRDAVLLMIDNITELYTFLESNANVSTWSLTHIVITDSQDNLSKTSSKRLEEQLNKFYHKIQMVKYHQLAIIQIQQNQDQQNPILQFTQTDSLSIYNIKRQDLQSTFDLIRSAKKSIGKGEESRLQGVRMNQNLIEDQLNENLDHKMICFTISTQNSMSKSWSQICDCIQNYTRYLNEQDLISVMVFGEQCNNLINHSIPSNVQVPPANEFNKNSSRISEKNMIQSNIQNNQIRPVNDEFQALAARQVQYLYRSRCQIRQTGYKIIIAVVIIAVLIILILASLG